MATSTPREIARRRRTLTCGIWFVDADGDGRGAGAPTIDCTQPEGTVAQSGDCDDSDSAVHPGATETCNLVDDDCDGSVDEAGGGTWFADVDGDGFGRSRDVLDRLRAASERGPLSVATATIRGDGPSRRLRGVQRPRR